MIVPNISLPLLQLPHRKKKKQQNRDNMIDYDVGYGVWFYYNIVLNSGFGDMEE